VTSALFYPEQNRSRRYDEGHDNFQQIILGRFFPPLKKELMKPVCEKEDDSEHCAAWMTML